MSEALIGLTLSVLIVLATIGMIAYREHTRKIAAENEHLNVVPDDTKRAFWSERATLRGTDGDSDGEADEE